MALAEPHDERAHPLLRQQLVDVVPRPEAVDKASLPEGKHMALVAKLLESLSKPVPESVKCLRANHRLSSEELAVQVVKVFQVEAARGPDGVLAGGPEKVALEEVGEGKPLDLRLLGEGLCLDEGALRLLPLALVRDHNEWPRELRLDGDGGRAAALRDLHLHAELHRHHVLPRAVEELQVPLGRPAEGVERLRVLLDRPLAARRRLALVRVPDDHHLHARERLEVHVRPREQGHHHRVVVQLLALRHHNGERLLRHHQRCNTASGMRLCELMEFLVEELELGLHDAELLEEVELLVRL
mmetsp:Transcript_7370/g.31304  ORF Transcript_7370/g.31304 Transcript_7370/m.31304 type:complete len:299 (+) Transcript_7370:379-1275(+)